MTLRMRKLGILTVAAAGSVLVAATLWAASKSLTVTVFKPEAPTCSLVCTSGNSDCNTRDSGGVTNLNYAVTGEPGPSFSITSDVAPNPLPSGTGPASSSVASSAYTGYSRTFTLSASNSEGSCSASVTAIFSSFLAGTKITMADGSLKNIEDIVDGDEVKSYDVATGRYVSARVTLRVTHTSANWFTINDKLNITTSHKIFANSDWTWSQNLKVGDTLFNEQGEQVAITSIQHHTTEVQVYNLFTEFPNTFFAESFLVHNKKRRSDHAGHGLLPGTRVTLADGRRVPVEKVKAGDKIKAVDPETGMLSISTVKGTEAQKVKGYLVLNGKLKVAKGHPVFALPKAKKGKK